MPRDLLASPASEAAPAIPSGPRDLLAPVASPLPAGQPGGPSYNAGHAFQSGATQGMTLGFADELTAAAMTPIEMVVDAVQGKPFDPGRSFSQVLDGVRGMEADMQAENPTAATVGNVVGGLATGVGAASNGLTLMNAAKPTVASMLPRAAAEGAAYGAATGLGTGEENKIGSAIDGALWGGTGGALLGAAGGALANSSARAAAGSVDDLKSQAGALYDAARSSGVVAPQQATQYMAGNLRQIATSNGIISPTGRVNSTYPEIAEVLRTMDDYALGTMDVPQMQSVRQVLSDAAKSQKPGERRIAVLMLEEFDKVTNTLAPQLREANGIYHRAMNADLLEEAILVAKQKSGQYNRSLDVALREQFGNLERQIIKGDLRGFSEAEQAAISAVAQGGPIERVLGIIGRAAPTGAVSFGAGFGVPFAVGNVIGGPAVGAAAGAGAVGAGFASRGAASAMINGNTRNAVLQSLVGGGAAPTANPAIAGSLQALVSASGQQLPQNVPGPSSLMRLMALN